MVLTLEPGRGRDRRRAGRARLRHLAPATSVPLWDDAIASVAGGAVSPSYADQTAIPGTCQATSTALAAQDCTPSLSTMATVTAPSGRNAAGGSNHVCPTVPRRARHRAAHDAARGVRGERHRDRRRDDDAQRQPDRQERRAGCRSSTPRRWPASRRPAAGSTPTRPCTRPPASPRSESNAAVKDASNTAIPKVTRSTYVGPERHHQRPVRRRGQHHQRGEGQLRQQGRAPAGGEPGELLQVRLLHRLRDRHRRRTRIVFGGGDQLRGPVHSNDQIKISTSPQPGGHLLRPGDLGRSVIQNQSNGAFSKPPKLSVAPDSDAHRGRPQQARQPGPGREHQVRRLHRRRLPARPAPGSSS